jgi:hypothetical protein
MSQKKKSNKSNKKKANDATKADPVLPPAPPVSSAGGLRDAADSMAEQFDREIADESEAEHGVSDDTTYTLEQLEAMRDHIDYRYTVLKAQLKLQERRLCKYDLCVSCRMEIAGVRGQITGLEGIQQSLSVRINALAK